MRNSIVRLLAATSLVCVSTLSAATFPGTVVSYNPGVGFVPHYTDASTLLGQPSRVNPYGDATDPFDPAYGTDQILSLGTGGSVTVRFDTPVLNLPRNKFGRDFTIFGNSGF